MPDRGQPIFQLIIFINLFFYSRIVHVDVDTVCTVIYYTTIFVYICIYKVPWAIHLESDGDVFIFHLHFKKLLHNDPKT